MSQKPDLFDNEFLQFHAYTQWLSDHEDEYEFASRERAVAGLAQSIWQHWKYETGPCAECPYSCQERPYHPNFGGFNFEAEVIVVGEEPGGGNAGDGNRDVEAGRKKSEVPDLYEQHGYSLKYRHSWPYDEVEENPDESQNYGTLIQTAARLTQRWADLWDGSLKFSECYYTNAKKCPEISNPEESPVWDSTEFDPAKVNEIAFDQCSSYLQREIQLVSPTVIMPFGKDAVRRVAQALNRESEVSELVSPGKWAEHGRCTEPDSIWRDTTERPYIVPSYFPTRATKGHLPAVLTVVDNLR
ncbi:uracil-DNA glycosylase family protein [Salinigranum halophilum]|uniref:uracil-DNA glycosylase family protein n=1 Tax=Salinigranum halophilum TaxID=2565931 RepID=UPI0010A91643|nr:uracil-DNA glycosylase family protein [Salinigranum halophilum]